MAQNAMQQAPEDAAKVAEFEARIARGESIEPKDWMPERYRKQEEVRKWQIDDPIGKVEKLLLERGVTQAEIEAREAEAEAVVVEAEKFAEESPFPAPEELYRDIYVEP